VTGVSPKSKHWWARDPAQPARRAAARPLCNAALTSHSQSLLRSLFKQLLSDGKKLVVARALLGERLCPRGATLGDVACTLSALAATAEGLAPQLEEHWHAQQPRLGSVEGLAQVACAARKQRAHTPEGGVEVAGGGTGDGAGVGANDAVEGAGGH